MSNTTKPKVIAVKLVTYERLKKHGEMGDTFNDVLEKVLNDAEAKVAPKV